ncbi:NADH-quinone oxidoreductase subunit N [Helicobacter monodelphidis]|uniref:NADH-quinone oxidoreductase subunit NuoN n=1 Tax=Helicobacter sp. 15-1451 TaxID=2004995 RepID=UPI000DCCBE5A|nr:NADH-quinone oxidoreductase subunit NuoN [Helicobacter sp. 15-1451]RAX59282.1 NADH-quinone oxidoreductase subunit N [Helicobacter sp. 15-1451]
MLEPIQISLETLNVTSLLPMAIIIVGALVILIVDVCSKQNKFDSLKSFYAALCIIFIALDLGYILYNNTAIKGIDYGFFDFILVDGIALLSHIIILISSAFFILLTLTQKRFHEFVYPEFYALFLFVISGLQFMVATDNLILILIGLETSSLALYTLIAMHNRETAFEAAIKYFSMGALAAAFFGFGAMLIYVSTGEFQISRIISSVHSPELLFVGMLFILAAIGFKISTVPFHTWTPDVYEGSNALMAGYLSIAPKIAAFVVALRFFNIFFGTDSSLEVEWIKNLLYVLVVITITLPNIMALIQEDVKRMLAYSSISHAGFALAAVMIHTTQSVSALFFYWSLFLFTNLGAFSMLWVARQKGNQWHTRYDHPYSRFSGMVQIMPLGAVLMAIFMLSLAGVPPFALFWGKAYLISATINNDHIILAVIMAINSAISAYYYLKLVIYMFLKDPLEKNSSDFFLKNATIPLKSILAFSAFAVVCSIFYVDDLLGFIMPYVESSNF